MITEFYKRMEAISHAHSEGKCASGAEIKMVQDELMKLTGRNSDEQLAGMAAETMREAKELLATAEFLAVELAARQAARKAKEFEKHEVAQ